MNDFDLLSLLAEDKKKISYRPAFAIMTGSVLSAILLCEIIYWWEKQDRKPFYKFKLPASSNYKYKEGDSWCEALGFTRSEFDRALGKIGVRVKKRGKLPQDVFVWYWTDIKRITYYRLNDTYLASQISKLYVKQDSALRKAESSFSALDIEELNPALDKNPSGSSITTTTTGVVFPDSLVLHEPRITKLIEGIAKANRQAFVNELAAADENGQIEKGIVPYVKGMIRNGWLPSKTAQSDQRNQTINQRIDEIMDAAEAGCIILLDDKPSIIDGRYALVGASTFPLGQVVARELDQKISIQIQGAQS